MRFEMLLDELIQHDRFALEHGHGGVEDGIANRLTTFRAALTRLTTRNMGFLARFVMVRRSK